MRKVSRKVFERKCREGFWEAETDINQFGRVEIRDHNGERFTVTITDFELEAA